MARSPLRSFRGAATRLADMLQESVELLAGTDIDLEGRSDQSQLEPSLLQQCLELVKSREMARVEPIRTVHHFACTGGTLLSKCIAAMPNVQLLSELDPLSIMQLSRDKPLFAPTDMIKLLKQGSASVSSEVVIALFHAELSVVYKAARAKGMYLVIRDHTHSHFCTGEQIPDRPSLLELVRDVAPTRSLITVRNPLDSFLSLQANGWLHFQPPSFDEYCARYLSFLRRYEGAPVLQYEDFTTDPESGMRHVTDHLELPYFDGFMRLFDVFRLTGDSGRKPMSGVRAAPSRDGREGLRERARVSESYLQLCRRLGYEA